MSIGPWSPIFKGVDHAVGTNFGSTIFTNNGIVFTDTRQQSVHCIRVDLTDQVFSCLQLRRRQATSLKRAKPFR